jgi:hypothetical protein
MLAGARAAAAMDAAAGSGITVGSSPGSPSNGAYGPARPYLARVICNTRLTALDHDQVA